MNKNNALRSRLLTMLCAMSLLVSACGAPGTKESGGNDQNTGRKKVVVSVLQSNRFLETAKKLYEEKHPNTEIMIKSYRDAMSLSSEGEDSLATPEEYEKYVNSINAEVMSGKGPDIVNTEGLETEKYIKKGLLANVYDFMNGDSSVKQQDYFQNLWKSMEVNGGLYTFPIDATMVVMTANQELLEKAGIKDIKQPWTWKDYDQYTQQVREAVGNEVYANAGVPPENILRMMVSDQYSKLVDTKAKQAHFDNALFRQLVTDVDKMYANGTMNKEQGDFENSLLSYSPIMKVSDNALMIGTKVISSPTVEGTAGSGWLGNSTNYSINANSGVKQEAWSFLKFLISEEMQSSKELPGMPIHKAAYNKQFDALKEAVKSGKVTTQFGEIEVQAAPEELNPYRNLIEQLQLSGASDNKVSEIVSEEIKMYYSGQKSLDDVIGLIQNRVTTYLNE